MGLLSDMIDGASDLLGDRQFRDDVAGNAKKLILMPEHSPYGVGKIPPEEVLAKMPWQDLMELRGKLTSKADQNAIAPFEHRAYARENSDSAFEALQNVVATPMYTGAKVAHRMTGGALPIGGSRSDPSFHELGQGIRGAWEGWTK